jgi:glutathione-dependent peroxiredoxin
MLQSKEGQRLPNVTFPMRKNDEWVSRSTEEIFSGKNVVVFSLPGAFTPTCSSTHLPRFNELAPLFAQNGIDEIICISVNDTFVMNEWAKNQASENVNLIPDGAGQFTDAMGMLVDKSDIGFGKRSWRYSMLVKDGVIDKMFIEPEVPGDPFEVSDAETMLNYINPEALKSESVVVVTKEGCPFCTKAKSLLSDAGYQFDEVVVGKDVSTSAIKAFSGKETVPQIFIDGTLIGGSDDIASYLKSK